MANRNSGGQDYDDRNRSTGGREDWNSQSGREGSGVGRGYGEENRFGNRWYGQEHEGNRENWGGDRGYGRDIDWQQGQQGRGQQGQGQSQDWGRGREGGAWGSGTSGGNYSGSGQSGQGGYGRFGQEGYGQSRQGGYGQGGSSPSQGGYSQGSYGQGGYGNYNRSEEGNQGPHTGRGPQGYQRSSERIQEEVCEALTRHGQVDASGVTVRVENGEVTLEGTVNSRREKRLAEEAVEHLSGVKDVHNQLRVSQQQGNGGSQQETSAAYQAGLQSGGAAGATGSTSGSTSNTENETGNESSRGRK
jgi:osmotically-inducible protein OsmY